MMPSRPKGVLNHGIPAYGYGPQSVGVISVRTSAIERRSHWASGRLELSNLQKPASAKLTSSARHCAFSANAKERPVLMGSHVTLKKKLTCLRGSTTARAWISPSVSDCGAGEH